MQNNLKVFAFLAVVFAHVGYFIFSDHSIFSPFSNYGGVAVNIFYFLSAYGLSLSIIKWKGNLKGYYNKRLQTIVPSIWLMLIVFFVLDFVWHGHVYGFGYMIQSFLLWYPTSNLFLDINSPLWYITPLIIYYLTFPFFYREGKPWLSSFIFLIFGYLISKTHLIGTLFSLHYLAFPLGILWAHYAPQFNLFFKHQTKLFKIVFPILLFIFIAVTGIYSGVGTFYEQFLSCITMTVIVIFFDIVPIRSKILTILGAYSFEIYLLHWPLMSRFDIFYNLHSLPWLWLLVWIIALMGISELFKRVIAMICYNPQS
ncbi:MAG: acyltransferase [Candidatus Paceibacterota bacterium]|jgi:peptidoglycan/LPS O-acetylase OafA/YrhL